MALPFVPSDAGLLALQAAVVAAPRALPRPKALRRLHGRGWALIPIGSIVVVVFAIRYVSDTATGLTYLALVAVPLLAAVALGWVGRWRRPALAGAVVPLFAVAWTWRTSLTGEAAAALLSALSCVTLGALLAALTPARWLKVGIVLMAAADSWLVLSDLLQGPNATLIAAHPAAGLPRLQSAIFGTVSMGYGDLFVAGLLGAVLAAEAAEAAGAAGANGAAEANGARSWQWPAALATLGLAALFDLLFLVLDELPATVPVALALVVVEAARRRARRRPEGQSLSAALRVRWRRAAATPRPAR